MACPRSRLWRASCLLPGLCLALLTGCPGAGDTATGPIAGIIVEGIRGGTSTCHIPGNNETLIARAVELVNQERTSRGLAEVTLNSQLSRMAEAYCCEMIEQRFFSHENPTTGEGPAQRALNAGYIFLAIGENLAGGQTSPEQVISEWMQSKQGHRENILAAQWREVGVGVRTGGEYGVYWVLEFGNPP